MKQMISVIVPIYNEEKNIHRMYAEITDVLWSLEAHYSYELILVNDGSNDGSWQLITTLAHNDPHVKALNFSRNFGHQIALSAGYDYACGDAIITIDADLQDPPTLMVQMVQEWQKGAAIVYARRLQRDDSFFKKITALGYYRFLDAVSDVKIPRNVGDYRLINRQVLQALQKCQEKSRYLRGMVAWTGFKYAFVDFIRPNRQEGKTGYTWPKMIKLAFDGLTGFSLFPLKIAAFIGTFVIVSGCCMFTYISCDALFYRIDYPLFKWLVTIIYIFMGVQFVLLWLIGEYIGRIHTQQQNRPLYIIDSSLIRKQSTVIAEETIISPPHKEQEHLS